MSSEFQHIPDLDELNRQFAKTLPRKKKSTEKKERISIVVIVVAVVCFALACWNVLAMRKDDSEARTNRYENDYRDQLLRTRTGNQYIGINKVIYVEDKVAYVGVVNSSDSQRMVSIRIYDRLSQKEYYQSEKLRPGSILHVINLKETPSDNENMALEYEVCSLDSKESETYKMNVQFADREEK